MCVIFCARFLVSFVRKSVCRLCACFLRSVVPHQAFHETLETAKESKLSDRSRLSPLFRRSLHTYIRTCIFSQSFSVSVSVSVSLCPSRFVCLSRVFSPRACRKRGVPAVRLVSAPPPPVLPRPRREGFPFRAVRQRVHGPAGRPPPPHGDARRGRHLVQALRRRAGLEIRESCLPPCILVFRV